MLSAVSPGMAQFIGACPAGQPVPVDLQGVTPELFRMFLSFCYSGYLDAAHLRGGTKYQPPRLDTISPAFRRLSPFFGVRSVSSPACCCV